MSKTMNKTMNKAMNKAGKEPLPALQAADTPSPQQARLDENIVLFTRLLRAIGMRLGPASAIDAIAAARVVGIANKEHFHAALAACCVKRAGDRHPFRQAFFLFWQNPRLRERIRELLLPSIKAPATGDEDEEPLLRRLRDALGEDDALPAGPDHIEEIDIDATETASAREELKDMDFRMMSAEEITAAIAAIRNLRPALPRRKSRRFAIGNSGVRIDMGASLRAARRTGGAIIPIAASRRREVRPLVMLLDISGSMESYTRVMLHFMHTLMAVYGAAGAATHGFVFGTRLTNITRALRKRDIDEALAAVARTADDWAGGTRICDNLACFNKEWSRRVFAGNPQVLLITDGLERAHDEALTREMERLHKSCARLLWLNPLLRFDGFEAKSISIRRMLPHVDAFLPIHSLASVEEAAEALRRGGQGRGHAGEHLAPVGG